MDTTHAYSRLRAALRQRNVLAVAALALTLTTALSSYALASRTERIVLVPTLHSDTALSSQTPSPDYLEAVTRDVANLFLNRHPNNLSYFRDNILRLAHPSSHGEIEAALMSTERRLIATKSSTVFFPTEIYVDLEGLYSEIKGELQTYLGPERTATERKVFAADWRFQSMRLWLEDFYPIDSADSRSITTPIEQAEAQ